MGENRKLRKENNEGEMRKEKKGLQNETGKEEGSKGFKTRNAK